MEAIILFGVVLVVMGLAFAVPVGALRGGEVADRDASVLGAAIITLGLGGLNYLFVTWFVITDDLDATLLVFGLAPLAAGTIGALVVRRRINGPIRPLLLIAAAVLTLAGLPGYFALNVALLASVIAVISYTGGLLPNPRAIFSKLDPRL